MKKEFWLVALLALSMLGCDAAPECCAAETAGIETVGATDNTVRIALDSQRLSAVRVGAVETASAPLALIVAPGKIEIDPNRMAHVYTPLPGRITSLRVRLGDAVKAGQTVLTVDSPEAYAEIAKCRQARSAVREAKAAQVKAKADLDRLERLFKHRAAAYQDVVNARHEVVRANAAAEQAESAAEETRHRLEILGLTPGASDQEIVVRAPNSGKVLEINAASGEYRNDSGQPLMTIADLSTVWASSNVPESVIREITVGEQIEIRLAAYPGEVFRARVTRIADMVDPEARTVKVQATLANPRGRLRPEMFGEIRHSHGTRLVPVVPADAVIHGDGRSWLFVEKSRGVFQKVAVTTGADLDHRVPVLSGVEPGDRVVIEGAVLLTRQ